MDNFNEPSQSFGENMKNVMGYWTMTTEETVARSAKFVNADGVGITSIDSSKTTFMAEFVNNNELEWFEVLTISILYRMYDKEIWF